MKLLLHICCGPCAIYPIEVLKSKNIDITGFFYNPNIHPIDEFNRRRDNVAKLSLEAGLNVIYEDDFQQEVWKTFAKDDESRCNYCYSLRLTHTFEYAKQNSYDAVSTSLLVSPYQKHDLIIETCKKLSTQYGVDFFYHDFREGFRKGQQSAKDMGLYRQKYCGCILSLR